MCGKHWRMVSKKNQVRVYQHYRSGQCEDKHPSEEWMRAADDAIAEVASKEAGVGRQIPLDLPR